jgi:hypothetical protein
MDLFLLSDCCLTKGYDHLIVIFAHRRVEIEFAFEFSVINA